MVDGVAEIRLTGTLDAGTFREFQAAIEEALAKQPDRIVLFLEGLESMTSSAIRMLLFARQKMDVSDRSDIYAVAPKPAVREALLRADPEQEDIHILDDYDPAKIT